MSSINWLSNSQLENLVERYGDDETKAAFLGVFPINQLPTEVKDYPVLLIVNTQAHNLGGEHWFSIFISKQRRRGEVFDSARQPTDIRLMRWLNRFANQWRRNQLIYQTPFSPICGAYALYFVLNRLHQPSMKEVLLPQKLNYHPINDSFIKEWFEKLTSHAKHV